MTPDEPFPISEYPSQTALNKMAREDPPSLLAAILGDLPDHILTFAAEALCEVSEPDSRLLKAVQGLLQHPTTYVREGALYGLASFLSLEEVRKAIERVALQDEDATIRTIADELLSVSLEENYDDPK